MGRIFDASAIFISGQSDLNAFQSFSFARCAANLSHRFVRCLPAIRLAMYAVHQSHRLRLRNQLHFQTFESLRFALSTRERAIILPTLTPSIRLDMHPVTNRIMLRNLPCQTNLDSLQPLGFPFGARKLVVLHPVCPTIRLTMNPVFNRAIIPGLIVELDLDPLQPFRLSGRAKYQRVVPVNARSVAVCLHMRLSLERIRRRKRIHLRHRCHTQYNHHCNCNRNHLLCHFSHNSSSSAIPHIIRPCGYTLVSGFIVLQWEIRISRSLEFVLLV